MLQFLLGKIKFLFANKKLLGGATAVLTAIILGYQVYDHIYEQGRLAERIEMQIKMNEQFEAQRKEYEKLIKERMTQLSSDFEEQLAVEREKVKIEYRTREVIKYVDREIQVPAECDALAANIISVLQQATELASTAANGSTRRTD